MKEDISIINYEVGNISSICRAVEISGFTYKVIKTSKEVRQSKKIILPGVGAFSQATTRLKKNGLFDEIIDFANQGKPLLGICLGMQILFEKSFEFGIHKGLGLIKGKVVSFKETFKNKNSLKVPIIGWESVSKLVEDPILDSIIMPNKFYHLHSFYCKPEEKKNILLVKNIFEKNICVGIKKNNIYGFQFHPEKSREQGIQIIKNFCKL